MPKQSRTTKPKRKREDVNQAAARAIAELTGQPLPKITPGKNPFAQMLGALGGKKGGPARAASMTPEERSASASKAARERWKQEREKQH